MLNPFENDAFNVVELSAAIDRIPNMYGRLNQLNLMPSKGVRTTTIIVEERNGVLTLLPTKPRGAPGTVGNRSKRKVRTFQIPHIPHDDAVTPEEAQNIRQFGTENALESLAGVLAEKLQTMRNRHSITLEWLRVGAMKGLILDADGSTLFNLFTEFGITEKTVAFDLSTATSNVRKHTMDVKRHIEDNLLGDVMTGVRGFCGEEFFDAFTSHPNVEKAYANWEAAADRLGEDVRGGFSFGGIVFEEYRGRGVDPDDGTVRPFLAKDEVRFAPMGTTQTFQTFFGPADFNETVNTPGQQVYARQEPRKFGRGTDIHTQSNPLPICFRPGVLPKGTA